MLENSSLKILVTNLNKLMLTFTDKPNYEALASRLSKIGRAHV